MNSHRIVLKPIGFVRTSASEEEIKAKRKNIVSEIHVKMDLVDALNGVEEYSHIFVIFWMHKVPKVETKRLKVHPRGRVDMPLVGVFATRSRNHPNPIGLAVVEVMVREGSIVKVRGLDAIDGTPVLDIKPYDHIDVATDIRVPEWWLKLYREHEK